MIELIGTRYIGAFGNYCIDSKVAEVNGSRVDVPDDVLGRGYRLSIKYGLYKSPFEYVLDWAAYKLGLK